MMPLIDKTDESVAMRKVASDWHGGQASPLYAYASTGTITNGLTREIRSCLREAGWVGEIMDDVPSCPATEWQEELLALLTHIQTVAPEES